MPPTEEPGKLHSLSTLQLKKKLIFSTVLYKQHGIEGSSKNYWSRGVGCVRLLPVATLLEINQVVFF